ncbi:MAG: OmpH family outer membrane protein [Phycisphaerae bacterium]
MKSPWALIVVAATAGCVVLWSGRSDTGAQTAAPQVGPIAVVDMTRVFNECQQIKDINDYLQKQDEQFRAERDKLKEAADQKQAELEAFARGSPEYLERFKQWVKLQTDYSTLVRLRERQMLVDQTRWTRQSYLQIVQAVEQIAKDRHLALVLYRDEMDLKTNNLQELERRLRGRKVIYVDQALDITDQVLEKVNRDYQARGGLKSLQPQRQ